MIYAFCKTKNIQGTYFSKVAKFHIFENWTLFKKKINKNAMKLKVKNYLIVFFRIILTFLTVSLPFIFTKGAYQNIISKGYYLWYCYFILNFLFMICIVVRKNYYELVIANIQNENLVYHNFLLIKKTIRLKDILGYKYGIDDDGNEFICLFNDKNKKIVTLKVNIYSNLPEFLEALDCKNIGYELTTFQKTIEKIKKLFTNT